MDFAGEKERKGMNGVFRVTRHPSLMSMASFATGAALATPLAPEIALFVFLPPFALLGAAHQDHRHRAAGTLTPAEEEHSSLLPFGALLGMFLKIEPVVLVLL
jgi:uncharacterized membrane protein